jgi:hypothetical protein
MAAEIQCIFKHKQDSTSFKYVISLNEVYYRSTILC